MKWIPKIISLLLLWGSLYLVTVYIDPDLLKDILIQSFYLPYLLLLAITLWYTIAILIKSMVKSAIFTLTIMTGVVLSVGRIMHVGLFVVLLLTLVIESWYIYGRHEKIKSTNELEDRGSSI